MTLHYVPEMLLPSPVEEMRRSPGGIRWLVKRDDLIHPVYGGNKWRKIKYNLSAFRSSGKRTIVSIGGAFSNHLHALAGICAEEKIPFRALVQAKEDALDNPTLSFIKQQGAQLTLISREDYRKNKADFPVFEDEFYLPEGGTNALALQGLGEMVQEIVEQVGEPDYLAVAAGSGGTAAGILAHLPFKTQLLVVPVLKGYPALVDLERLAGVKARGRCQVIKDYHRGGFGRFDDGLATFMRAFFLDEGVKLDPVYTSKLFLAIQSLAVHGFFHPGAVIVTVHTGGLQGLAGMEYRTGKAIY